MFPQRFTEKDLPILGFLLCNRHFPALDPMNLLRETERQRQRERQRERLFQRTKPFTNGPADTRKMELEDSNS